MLRGVSEVGVARPTKTGVWVPVELRYLGSVGELMRMTTAGSKRDSTMGCGTTRKRTGPPPGQAC